MPTYNAEEFVTESVPSVLEQSFTNFELLVLDGGSDDKTLNYIKNLDSERIDVYENTGNITDALNKGVKEANGEYIARVDADSPPHSNWLEKCISFLEDNPEYAAVGTQARRIKTTDYSSVTNKPQCHASIVEKLPWQNPMIHPTLVVRKDILRKVGGYQDTHWEDYDLIIRLSQDYLLRNLSEVLVTEYIHDDSITGSTSSLKATLASLRCGILAIWVGDYTTTDRLFLFVKRILWSVYHFWNKL